jgi:polysaccharide pyruvyl transferase WcaK-like protein
MHQALSSFLAQQVPKAAIRSHPLPSWSLTAIREAPALFYQLRWADVVILAGGTHFHDSYGRRSIRILMTHWLLFRAARLFGASVGYAGVGVGPLHTRAGRWLTRRIINTACVTLVRDRSSAMTLDDLQVSPFITGFDSACLLERPPIMAASKPQLLGISLIPYFSTFEDDDTQDIAATSSVASALESVALKCAQSIEILAFNTQGRMTDIPISRRLHDLLQGRVPVSLYTCDTPDATLQHLSVMSGLIATRYHAALLGYIVGLPMIIVAYESKCVALARQIGLPEQAIILPEQLLQPDFLRDKIENLARSPESLRPTIPIHDNIQTAYSGLREFTERLLASSNLSAS